MLKSSAETSPQPFSPAPPPTIQTVALRDSATPSTPLQPSLGQVSRCLLKLSGRLLNQSRNFEQLARNLPPRPRSLRNRVSESPPYIEPEPLGFRVACELREPGRTTGNCDSWGWRSAGPRGRPDPVEVEMRPPAKEKDREELCLGRGRWSAGGFWVA